ncbi:uncharacterized protein LY79DRAFT_185235 [Colletotrichum navitas]|uniref:Uncharacterized protein n=1 Tax=Colletotrichum navitas TaxID=681940 RepID=A0AAD8Q0Z9_9PEZI|nr:uncharacterized protein LY79DRAFT_185235 [Colletotrichum navitas]KAK1593352.1 hypothetical protein LY79DRAFT_185235 [Colletotrichum navitas]
MNEKKEMGPEMEEAQIVIECAIPFRRSLERLSRRCHHTHPDFRSKHGRLPALLTSRASLGGQMFKVRILPTGRTCLDHKYQKDVPTFFGGNIPTASKSVALVIESPSPQKSHPDIIRYFDNVIRSPGGPDRYPPPPSSASLAVAHVSEGRYARPSPSLGVGRRLRSHLIYTRISAKS